MASLADVMHYESRVVRDALKSSRERVITSRAQVPMSLSPEQKYRAELDWIQPCIQAKIEETTLASGDPNFEDMKKALLDFETYGTRTATTKERAFFSALRTLLSEASCETDAEKRTVRISAAHKWFHKNRPGPSGEAPAIAAALAASLSIAAPTAGSPNALNQGMGHASSSQLPATALSGVLPPNMEKGKHDFFALYSGNRATSGRLSTADKQSTSAGGAPPGSPQHGRRAVKEPITSGRGHVSVEVPIVWQPSVSGVLSPQRFNMASSSMLHLRASPSATSLTSRAESVEPQAEGSKAQLWAPKGKARSVAFDPYNMETGPGAAHSSKATSNHEQQSDWVPGQSKPTQPVLTQAEKNRLRAEELAREQKEVAALIKKWNTIDQQIQAADANVEAQIQQWSHQRARLEEEIVRRQEASRFAAPAAKGHPAMSALMAGHTVGVMSGQSQGYLSPYIGFTTEKLGTQDGLPFLPGLLVNTDVTTTARDVRAAAQGEFEELNERLMDLGVQRIIHGNKVYHALSPVPDKPFLECIAMLPKPGDSLISRPDSIPQPKGKRGKSATKKKSRK